MGRLHRIEFKGYSDKKWHLYYLNLLCTFYQNDTSSNWGNCTRFMSRLKTQLFTIYSGLPCLRRDIQVTVRWGQMKVTQPLQADNGLFFHAFYFDQAPRATTFTLSYHIKILYDIILCRYHTATDILKQYTIIVDKMNNFWNLFFYGGKIEFQFRGHHQKWWMKCEKVK